VKLRPYPPESPGDGRRGDGSLRDGTNGDGPDGDHTETGR
jgi:hypothetical protein